MHTKHYGLVKTAIDSLQFILLFQELPGPTMISRTLQALENGDKNNPELSKTFQDAWEPWTPSCGPLHVVQIGLVSETETNWN